MTSARQASTPASDCRSSHCRSLEPTRRRLRLSEKTDSMRKVIVAGGRGFLAAAIVACSSTSTVSPTSSADAPTATRSSPLVGVTAPTPAMGWNSFDVLSSSRAGYGQTWLNEAHIEAGVRRDASGPSSPLAMNTSTSTRAGAVDFAWTTNSFEQGWRPHRQRRSLPRRYRRRRELRARQGAEARALRRGRPGDRRL